MKEEILNEPVKRWDECLNELSSVVIEMVPKEELKKFLCSFLHRQVLEYFVPKELKRFCKGTKKEATVLTKSKEKTLNILIKYKTEIVYADAHEKDLRTISKRIVNEIKHRWSADSKPTDNQRIKNGTKRRCQILGFWWKKTTVFGGWEYSNT